MAECSARQRLSDERQRKRNTQAKGTIEVWRKSPDWPDWPPAKQRRKHRDVL